MENREKIYIVLTQTGTMLSKIVKIYTRGEYGHISLALDEKLEEMYSFGRLNAYNPFIGGFVHEGINIGTFKRFNNTKAEIYCLEVTHEQYEKITEEIEKIKNNPKKYKFNFIGLVCAGVNYKLKRKNAFYCAEFVKHIINNAEIGLELPEIIKPIDFKHKLKDKKITYKGLLKNYN